MIMKILIDYLTYEILKKQPTNGKNVKPSKVYAILFLYQLL
jgi:hypothetical protein